MNCTWIIQIVVDAVSLRIVESVRLVEKFWLNSVHKRIVRSIEDSRKEELFDELMKFRIRY